MNCSGGFIPEMIKALVMAGGSGSRLHMPGAEKPLLKVCGESMIERVVDAVNPLVGEVYVAISKNTLKTAEWVMERGYRLVRTEGMGYPEDLRKALTGLSPPILILPADLPFINTETLISFLKEALTKEADIVTLIVSRDCFPEGMRKNPSPIGISVINGRGSGFENIIMCRYPEFLDIDTRVDFLEALKICKW